MLKEAGVTTGPSDVSIVPLRTCAGTWTSNHTLVEGTAETTDGTYQCYPVNSTFVDYSNVATSAFIRARHSALTGGDQIIGPAICGKGPPYPI